MPSKIPKKNSTKKGRKALRLHDKIARGLGIRIVSNRLLPGDKLDGEIEASERLQVSRAAYREAMQILSAKGLVNSRPKVGTRISEPSNWRWLDPDLLSWFFAVDPDESLLSSLLEFCTIVEPHAASLAAHRRTVNHINRLQRALNTMARHDLSGETARLAECDFHATVLHASGNLFLTSLSDGLVTAVSWISQLRQRKNQPAHSSISTYQDIYHAIKARDHMVAHKAMSALISTCCQ